MSESTRLRNARDHLARAEVSLLSSDGLTHLEEGLALLDDLIADEIEVNVAKNLAASYAAKVFGRVKSSIASDRAVPQPQLEHCFKLMLAFDDGDFELPQEARSLKVAVVRRLVELFYEGYPEEQKQAALRKLDDIAD